MDGMEFTANYSPAKYKEVDDLSLQDLKYRLKLGRNGALGTAKWDGQHSVRITEGEVNGKLGMTIKCSNSTKVVVNRQRKQGEGNLSFYFLIKENEHESKD